MMRYKGGIERAKHVYDRTMPLSVEDIADVIVRHLYVIFFVNHETRRIMTVDFIHELKYIN